MQAKLVAITKPLIDGINTADEFIAYAARVSNPANQLNSLTAPNLIKYLANNSHWSPFEMASATMEIKTTRRIARQILRHRSFAFQEFSQRYATVHDLGFVIAEARLQDTKNRQNSISVDNPKLQQEWEERQNGVIAAAMEAYDWALNNNIAKEQSAVVLPEGNTVSVMYMAGTIRSWIHYCLIRGGNGTQKEHMQVAEACKNELITHLPSLEPYLNAK